MQIKDYHAYTQSLVDLAQADERIEGLIMLGSSAGTHHQPDRWSDHDFWLVVKDGTEDDYHADLSWIPQIERKVLAFRETRHGWKILFDDGHVLEYAIFPLNELYMARFHHIKLLVDKTDIAERLDKMKASQDEEHEPSDPLKHVQFLLSLLVIGMGRYHRGEQVSAMVFIKYYALEQLTTLIQALVPPQHPQLVDDLNPNRRIEQTHPYYAEQLQALITDSIPDAANRLLDIALTFADGMPDFPHGAISTVRDVIEYDAQE